MTIMESTLQTYLWHKNLFKNIQWRQRKQGNIIKLIHKQVHNTKIAYVCYLECRWATLLQGSWVLRHTFWPGETRKMDYQFGHHYYTDKKQRSTRVHVQGTRKIGCKALTRVYSIPRLQHHWRWSYSLETMNDERRKANFVKESYCIWWIVWRWPLDVIHIIDLVCWHSNITTDAMHIKDKCRYMIGSTSLYRHKEQKLDWALQTSSDANLFRYSLSSTIQNYRCWVDTWRVPQSSSDTE